MGLDSKLSEAEFMRKLHKQLSEGAPFAVDSDLSSDPLLVDPISLKYPHMSPEHAAMLLVGDVLESERSADYSRIFFG